PRVRVVPFGLAPLQVFRVGRERGERALRRGALEQLAAPLQLGLELLLRFGKPLQRLPRGVRVELGERLLQLAESLLELGRDRASGPAAPLAPPRGSAAAGRSPRSVPRAAPVRYPTLPHEAATCRPAAGRAAPRPARPARWRGHPRRSRRATRAPRRRPSRS